MKEELAMRYYQLALSCAKKRNLSKAVIYARHSLRLNAESEKAHKLLGLCLYELGELDSAMMALKGFQELSREVCAERERTIEALGRVREFVARKKWRKADVCLQGVGHESVRLLNMRGCVKAAAGRYGQATRLFSLAMNKDRGNRRTQRFLILGAVSLR